MTNSGAEPGPAPIRRTPVGASATGLALLAAVALFLRWFRLDLVSFRYDTAETFLITWRSIRETGLPPLLGIVNSLGFRNPGGLEWLIAPPLYLSPRVEVATGWTGLLTVTALWPLYRISRRLLPGRLWLIPCAAFAVMPSAVFAGRSVWAQNLLPVFGAWALWTVLVARDPAATPSARGRAFFGAAVFLGAAATVHLCAGAYIIAAAILLARPARWRAIPRRWLAAAFAALAATGALLLPSALDWRASRTSPASKPEHVLKFEANMPPPPSLLLRIRDSVAGQFAPFSSAAPAGGLELQIDSRAAVAAAAADAALFAAALTGLARLLFSLRRTRPRPGETPPADGGSSGALAALAPVVTVWLAVPAVVAALFVSRLNSTYFAAGLPAVLILAAVGAEPLSRRIYTKALPAAFAAGLVTVYGWYFLDAMSKVDRSRVVNGLYYIPLADQERTARRFKLAGVPAGHIDHLSGLWYQLPYDYLHAAVAGAPAAPPAPGSTGGNDDSRPWAVLDDPFLRRRLPQRAAWLERNLSERLGSAVYEIAPDKPAARRLRNAFFALPME